MSQMLVLVCCLLLVLFSNSVFSNRNKPMNTSIRDCCSRYLQSDKLFLCVNASSNNFRKQSLLKGLSSSVKIGLTSYASKNIIGYSSYSFALDQVYCELNNYFCFFPNIPRFDSDQRWNKVKLMENSIDPINGWAKDLDYIVWLDADLIFLNLTYSIESIILQNSAAHIIFSAEHDGSTTLINSGAFIVRNSAWSRSFLSEWWNFRNRTLYSDQEQFDLLYQSQRDNLEYIRRIAVLPPTALNTDPPAIQKQGNRDPVLHLMGETNSFREEAFRFAFHAICDQLDAVDQYLTLNPKIPSQPLPPPSEHSYFPITFREKYLNRLVFSLEPQLGLNKSKLLSLSLLFYSQSSLPLLRRYLNQTCSEKSNRFTNSGKQSRELLNVLHHLSFALTLSSQFPSTETLDVLLSKYPDLQKLLILLVKEKNSTILPMIRESLNSHFSATVMSLENLLSALDNLSIDISIPENDGEILSKESNNRTNSSLTFFPSQGLRSFSLLHFSQTLRVCSFALLYHNLKERKKHIDENHQTEAQHENPDESWPEQLKIVAESAQYLLSIGTPLERFSSSDLLISLLYQTLSACHPEQHDAVGQMISHVRIDRALLLTDIAQSLPPPRVNQDQQSPTNNDPSLTLATPDYLLSLALEESEQAVEIAIHLSQASGAHFLPKSLGTHANLLCIASRFTEAFPYHRQTIDLSSKHLGDDHPSLAQLHLNFATCIFQITKQSFPIDKIDKVGKDKVVTTNQRNNLQELTNQINRAELILFGMPEQLNDYPSFEINRYERRLERIRLNLWRL